MFMILGYLSAALIGISLGLIGGGGSILTVPVLVYLFALSPVTATSYSLFVVGITSVAGAFNNWKKKQLHFPTAFFLGMSSVVTVLAVRSLVIPRIPKTVATIGSVTISFSFLTMVVFATLMLFASFSMMGRQAVQKDDQPRSRYQLLLYGLMIGLVTGFLGAGGGFLLIPALVLIVKLDMKTAVGTSLLIIAINSLIGFTADLGQYKVDWNFLLPISLLAIGGVFVGGYIGRFVQGAQLKRGFGVFVLLMALYILIKEISALL